MLRDRVKAHQQCDRNAELVLPQGTFHEDFPNFRKGGVRETLLCAFTKPSIVVGHFALRVGNHPLSVLAVNQTSVGVAFHYIRRLAVVGLARPQEHTVYSDTVYSIGAADGHRPGISGGLRRIVEYGVIETPWARKTCSI
jgi:hypothetical protein